MTKVVIDARISGTSTGRYVDKLIEYLAKIETDIEFAVLVHPNRVEYIKLVAPDFSIVKTEFKSSSFGEQIGLKKQIKSLKPDLVHFPMVQQPAWYRGKVVTSMLDLTTTRFKNPSKNNLVFAFKQSVYKWLNKKVAKKSKHIITISDYVKDELIKEYHLPEAKLTTTYCAADKITEKAKPLKELKDQDFLMYVGRPQPHKNLGRLIEAFKILHEQHPKLKLVLSGKKDELFLQHEKRVGELGLSKYVVFTDFVTEGELRWLYENCRAFVFPSLSEGFGLPGLEAMVHGAPVISSNATCLPEIYDGAAYYFNPLDVEDMATIISHVLENDKLRKSLIEKGRAQARLFSWQRMAEQTLIVYNKVLNT